MKMAADPPSLSFVFKHHHVIRPRGCVCPRSTWRLRGSDVSRWVRLEKRRVFPPTGDLTRISPGISSFFPFSSVGINSSLLEDVYVSSRSFLSQGAKIATRDHRKKAMGFPPAHFCCKVTCTAQPTSSSPPPVTPASPQDEIAYATWFLFFF